MCTSEDLTTILIAQMLFLSHRPFCHTTSPFFILSFPPSNNFTYKASPPPAALTIMVLPVALSGSITFVLCKLFLDVD